MPFIIALFIVLSTPALSSELPDGWRLPTEKELTTEPPRDGSPTKYARASSDVNNDGKIDHVYLLKSTRYPGEGLLIKLSTLAGYEWQLLDHVEWGEEYADAGLKMRIDLAKPGEYKTACASGYWQCGAGEPAILKLKRAAIWQDRFDGATAIWYWDTHNKIIRKVWLGG